MCALAPSAGTGEDLQVALPESLAEPWSAMTLGRPGTGCVVRYQTAWSTSVAWTLL